MVTHSSTLAWKIPWTEEPGRLQSMGSLRVGHDSASSLSLFIFMHWRRKWQPSPVFLPGEAQRQRSLVGCSLWGHTESDMTEATQQQQQQIVTVALKFVQTRLIKALQGSEGILGAVSAQCLLFLIQMLLCEHITTFQVGTAGNKQTFVH